MIGFAVWESYGKRIVTFPARSYDVHGERGTFALLRPVDDQLATRDSIRELILTACHEAQHATASLQ